MEDNCFTILCWLLPYNVNQSQVYICPLPSESLPTSTPSHSSRLSESTGWSSLSYAANSHGLSTSHIVMYMFQCYSPSLSHCLLPLLCPKSVLYVCVPTPALQTDSSVSFFYIPYICVTIQNLFFSF